MKKVITLISLIALIALVSCSTDSEGGIPQQEEPQEQAQHAVGFAVSRIEGSQAAQSRAQRAAMTRAEGSPAVGDGELTTELLREKGFGVYCWYTGTDNFTPPLPLDARSGSSQPYLLLMRNQKVEYTAPSSQSPWTYTPSKYWPLNTAEKLTFRAYAPYQSGVLPVDASGMPLLPVKVDADDYHNGTQHDPLWGTGLHDGIEDGDDATTGNEVYGKLYDNYTFTMSGSQLAKDERDGTIDWYFHHAMAKLLFNCYLIPDAGCDQVVIRSVTITPLYDSGLLSISSGSESGSDKPLWTNRTPSDPAAGMTVELSEATPDNTIAGDLAPTPTPDPEPAGFNPYPLVITSDRTTLEKGVSLLSQGLLIIPREFTSVTPMTVTISYTIDSEESPLTAVGTISGKEFLGNTVYTLNLRLTPATQGLEITLVQSAFTPWEEGLSGDRDLYNW